MVATPLATATPVIGTGCQLFGASVSEVSKTHPTAAAGHFTATFAPLATTPTFGCGMVMKRMPSIATWQFVEVPPTSPKNNSPSSGGT